MMPRDLRAQENLDEEVENCAATYPSLISSGDSLLLSEDLRRGRHSSSVNSCRNPYYTIALYRLNFASSASIRCGLHLSVLRTTFGGAIEVTFVFCVAIWKKFGF